MSLELSSTLCEVIQLAGNAFGRQLERHDVEGLKDWIGFLRQHIFDRWYRFAPFGVQQRSDLEGIVVEIAWTEEPSEVAMMWGFKTSALRTSIRVAGTPLDGK